MTSEFVALHTQYSSVRPGQVLAFGVRDTPPAARFELRVNAIQFASPGFTDVAGIASALKEIRELIQWAIERFGDRKFRQVALEKEILERDLLKIEVNNKLLSLLESHGTSKMPVEADQHFGIVRQRVPNVDALIDSIIEERLLSSETVQKKGYLNDL